MNNIKGTVCSMRFLTSNFFSHKSVVPGPKSWRKSDEENILECESEHWVLAIFEKGQNLMLLSLSRFPVLAALIQCLLFHVFLQFYSQQTTLKILLVCPFNAAATFVLFKSVLWTEMVSMETICNIYLSVQCMQRFLWSCRKL